MQAATDPTHIAPTTPGDFVLAQLRARDQLAQQEGFFDRRKRSAARAGQHPQQRLREIRLPAFDLGRIAPEVAQRGDASIAVDQDERLDLPGDRNAGNPHGDQKTSKVIGRRVGELPQIAGAFVAAIVRDLDKSRDIGFLGLAKQKQKGRVLIAHKDVVIETDDHVIVFCLDKKVVKQVEKLFAVGFHFF